MPLRHTLRLTVARVVGGAVTVALVGLAVPGQTAAAAAPSYDARTTSASTTRAPRGPVPPPRRASQADPLDHAARREGRSAAGSRSPARCRRGTSSGS